MSFQSDLYTALSSVASGKVFPQLAEQETELPFVVYRFQSKTPSSKLDGEAPVTNYIVLIECWAETYIAALALADQVRSAINASSLVSYEESASGEDFEPILDAFMEPVTFGFWAKCLLLQLMPGLRLRTPSGLHSRLPALLMQTPVSLPRPLMVLAMAIMFAFLCRRAW